MIDIDKVYNEDCLDGLARLEDNSVDLICTDPPYCVGMTSNGQKGNLLDNNLIRPFFQNLFRACSRVLKVGGGIYVNTDWRTYPFLYTAFNQHFIQRNLIVWKKGKTSQPSTWYRYNHELIMFGTKGFNKFKFECKVLDIWEVPLGEAMHLRRLHPTQKPIELINKIVIDGSDAGDVVLDCFMGSGTTAAACIKNNRHFIGFEIDEKYYNIANDRISKARAEKAQWLF